MHLPQFYENDRTIKTHSAKQPGVPLNNSHYSNPKSNIVTNRHRKIEVKQIKKEGAESNRKILKYNM